MFSKKTKLKLTDYECVDNSVDLVYSASAFHWIPEEVGYSKVYSMLKPGGVFARFANHPFPDKGRLEVSQVIQDVYKTYAPHRGGKYAPPAAIFYAGRIFLYPADSVYAVYVRKCICKTEANNANKDTF